MLTAHSFTSTSSAYAVEIPRPLKYKVTSIRDKIQSRGIAPINNKNSKDISIIFVTQHQLRDRSFITSQGEGGLVGGGGYNF